MDLKCEVLFLCVYFFEVSHWWGATLSKALDVMHISPCLEDEEGLCSKHKHLKPAGKPLGRGLEHRFCVLPSASVPRVSFLWQCFQRCCVWGKKLSLSGVNLEQLYFSVVTSQKTLQCSTGNEGMGLAHEELWAVQLSLGFCSPPPLASSHTHFGG